MEASEAKPPSGSPNPVRILLVEDSPLNAQITLKQLESLGYSAEPVTNGVEALAALERSPFDIVLMDCQMPEMDGYETTWQIRERERQQAPESSPKPKVRIIALTANNRPQDRERCLTSGMDDYVTKPVQLVELEVALQRATLGPGDAQSPAEILDPLVLAGLRQLRKPGQEDPLAGLIELFLRGAPAQFQALEKSIAARDMSGTLAAASSFKGNAANLGARRLAELCGEIEEAARAGNLEEAGPILEQAKNEFTRVEFALRREQKRLA